jgi:hypothetical protein
MVSKKLWFPFMALFLLKLYLLGPKIHIRPENKFDLPIWSEPFFLGLIGNFRRKKTMQGSHCFFEGHTGDSLFSGLLGWAFPICFCFCKS